MNNITGSSSDSDVSKRDVSAVPITNATTPDIIIKAQYIDILAGRDGRDGLQEPVGVKGEKGDTGSSGVQGPRRSRSTGTSWTINCRNYLYTMGENHPVQILQEQN